MNTLARLQRPASAIGRDDFVRVEGVVKRFGQVTVVDRLSLSIKHKEMFALLGSSGCGKTTLLRMMAGLETPSEGRIWLDGEDITALPPHRRPVNMMFQSYALFPHMTVEGNVGYGLRRERVPRAEIAERVADALDLVQMRPYARHMPAQLSGGQQQRAALARSLVKRPKLLLLDEPMSALDKKIRQQTQFELGSILWKVGVTCVMVTHDQEEAMTMADRIAVMSEGRIVQTGTPEEVYEAPNSRFAAEFIGSTNIFAGRVAPDAADRIACAELPVPLALPHAMNARAGHPVTVSVRPERIGLARADERDELPAANAAWGRVEQIGYMGSYTLYFVRLPSNAVVVANVPRGVLVQMAQAPDYGDPVRITWSPRSMVVLG
jgi:putrescine transport system ATP-binding protein